MDNAQQVEFQRHYYAATAGAYSDKHNSVGDDHDRALRLLFAWAPMLGVRTLLDVGAGTGRVHRAAPAFVEVTGVEPVAALRLQGHNMGIPADRLLDGDATALAFPENSFDLVSECGVLHHVADDQRAVDEMCRVARVGVFISDSNNYGQGSAPVRLAKRVLRRAGLWPAADFIKNGGKRYFISEGDGLAYSYSVFDSLPRIRRKFPNVYFLGVKANGANLLATAPHLAVLCLR